MDRKYYIQIFITHLFIYKLLNKNSIWNCRKPLILKIYSADTLIDLCTVCSLLMTAWSSCSTFLMCWCISSLIGHLWKLSDQAPPTWYVRLLMVVWPKEEGRNLLLIKWNIKWNNIFFNMILLFWQYKTMKSPEYFALLNH